MLESEVIRGSESRSAPMAVRRRPARLVFVLDAFEGPIGGTEVQLMELLTGLDRSVFAPELVVLRRSRYLDGASPFPCPVSVLDVGAMRSPKTWSRLAEFAWRLRRRRVRLVHILLNDAAIIGPLFCRLGGARVVVGRRDLGFWQTPTLRRLLRWVNLCVDVIIVNSEAVGRQVRQHERFTGTGVMVVRNGLSAKRFLEPADPDLRSRLGVPVGAPIVCMVANMKPLKRHADLLAAFARVRRRHQSAHLVLVGAGSEERSLRALADQLGIAAVVHFLGCVLDPVPIVKSSDVCVLTSETEGLSNSLLEYMACGKPIVCTAIGGNPEVVTEGGNGFLVGVGEALHLAERIERLLLDPAMAARFGRAGREMFDSQFTTERMVAAHQRIYADVLSGGVAASVRSRACEANP